MKKKIKFLQDFSLLFKKKKKKQPKIFCLNFTTIKKGLQVSPW